MKTIEQADATAHALDLLPPTDPARSDPALRRNPALAEEVRATRELAADVWLSVAPLRTAPPGVLAAVLGEIEPTRQARAAGRARWLAWVAASGWAAAAAVVMIWWAWPSGGEPVPQEGANDRTALTGGNPEMIPVPERPSRRRSDSALRQEIQRLQARLARHGHEPRGGSTPRVMALLPPGGIRPSAEETRAGINTLLVDALCSALAAENATPGNPVTLVIERGWPPGGVALPHETELVRHRNFPEASWRELGLLRSATGEFFDPANDVIWSPEPEGRGFLGRQRTVTDDLAGFSAEPVMDGAPAGRVGLAMAAPKGFLIEDPVNGTTQVVMNQLPPLPPDIATVVRWNAADGPQTARLDELLAANHSAADGGTLVLTLPNSSGLTSFQVMAVPTLPNAGPAEVIMASDP